MLVKFEQNRMTQTTRNFELLTKKYKCFFFLFFFFNHFWQSVGILEDVSVVETIVECWNIYFFQATSSQCCKNNGSPTSVTRLKVAPNMTDVTSIKYAVSSLKGTSVFS